MGAHAVVLELLQIPYEKVRGARTRNAALQSGMDSHPPNSSQLDKVGEGQ